MASAKLVGKEKYSIVSNYLGTPESAYDSQGNKVWSCELDIYGKIKHLEGDAHFVPFRYQGQYHDTEIDLYYNRFRYYSPESGMYVSQDPIGLSGGSKFYAYVNNPNSKADVFGLIELEKVPYGDHDLAEAVRVYREQNPNITPGQNVAAMKVEGIDDPIVRHSMNGKHSEHFLLEELEKTGSHGKVTALYTELEPCSGIGMPSCKTKLTDKLPSDTKVTYSYDYPISDKTAENKKKRRKGVYDKKKEVKKQKKNH